MIRSVEIKGLRGIREGKLADLTPLVVLVGPNAAGKSTILEALYIGAGPDPGEAVGRAVVRRLELSRGARWLIWKAGTQGPARIEISTDTSVIRECELSVGRLDEAPHPRVKGNVWDKPGQRGPGFTVEFPPSSSFVAASFSQPLDGVTGVRFVDQRAKALQAPLHQLYTEAYVSGRIAETRALIQSLMPAVEDIRILVEGDSPFIFVVYPDRAVPAAMAGDGVFSLLRLSLELTTCRGGSVLLEEPEIHLHPGGIRACARVIMAAVRSGIQVVLTTHSLDLIDDLLSESSDEELNLLSLYSMHLEDGVLKLFRSAGPDVAFARTQLQDDLR